MRATARLSSDTATVLLAAGLTLCGAGLAASVSREPLLTPPLHLPLWTLTLALTAAFFLTDLCVIRVEIRQQSCSLLLSGVPTLLGLLWCTTPNLVMARLVGGLAVFVVRKASPVKAAFNGAEFLFTIALGAAALHGLLGRPTNFDVVAATALLLVSILIDVVAALLVLTAIRMHGAPIGNREVMSTLSIAAAFAGVNAAAAVLIVVLSDAGTLGTALLAGCAVGGGLTYRSFMVLRRRHEALALVQAFVEHSVGSDTVAGVAERLLARARDVLQAGRVELLLVQGGERWHVVVDANDTCTVRGDGDVHDDWLVTGVQEHGQPMLLPRSTRERPLRQWLQVHAARDAIVLALPGPSPSGALLVLDRLGDLTTFTEEDLTVAQTLVGHLTIALRNSDLVQQLRFDATHDALTGLANRTLLLEALHDTLRDVDPARPPAVLLLDVDRFKEVNDALGHPVGDELLRVVGERLRRLPFATASVARLGGDEFALVLPGVPDAHALAQQVAEAITAALSEPVQLADAALSTHASIGIAFGEPGCRPSDLLRRADTAMYAAKTSGQPMVSYTADLDRGRAERLTLLADLHRAIDEQELDLVYQPQLDLASGTVGSVEALVRWDHPLLGRLPPNVFVPLAESSGLIDALTAAVLRMALRQCRAWQDAGLGLSVAVNLSARNVNDPKLPELIGAALAQAGLPASRLILEITESSVMGDPDRTVPILQRLADMGITLSLDDFGTGYSSLSYLQRLPVREIKIDRSFIADMTNAGAPATSEALLRGIVALGSSLGHRVVAEGVEHESVLVRLGELGCHAVQGYHISHPEPAARIPAVLARFPGDGRRRLLVVR